MVGTAAKHTSGSKLRHPRDPDHAFGPAKPPLAEYLHHEMARRGRVTGHRKLIQFFPTFAEPFFDHRNNMPEHGIEPFLAYTSQMRAAAKKCYEAMPAENLVTASK